MHTSHLAVSKDPRNNPDEILDEVYFVASTRHRDPVRPADPPRPPAGRWLVHVSPTVVRNADWPLLPPTNAGEGLVLFGTSCYHRSNVYLAWAPLDPGVALPIGPGGLVTDPGMPVPPPSTWLFWVDGAPATASAPANWRLASDIAPGSEPTTLLATAPGLGELSAGWHPPLRRWVMAYVTGGKAFVRTSRAPYGPWSPSLEVQVFDGSKPALADPEYTADNLIPGHQFVGLKHDFPEEHGRATGPYAPYLIPRWTRFDRSVRVLTLYYTLSTEHPPYNVQLMRSRLLCP